MPVRVYAGATFTAIDVNHYPSIDGCSLYIKEETAEFYVQTVFTSAVIDTTFIDALIYKPDVLLEINDNNSLCFFTEYRNSDGIPLLLSFNKRRDRRRKRELNPSNFSLRHVS